MTRVLIVEDEESLADPLAYLLRKEGFEVAAAADGRGAAASAVTTPRSMPSDASAGCGRRCSEL